MHTLSGRLVDDKGDAVAGWSIEVTFLHRPDDAPISKASKPARPEQAAPTPVRVVGESDVDGNFALLLPPVSEFGGRAQLSVSTPSGTTPLVQAITVKADGDEPLVLVVDRVDEITVEAPTDDLAPARRLTGRVFDIQGRTVPAALQVVLSGGPTPETAQPLVLMQTEPGGYLRADYPIGSFAAAYVRVAGVRDPVTVPTKDGAIPNPLLVGVSLDEVTPAHDGCEGDCTCTATVPRAPDATDLVNSPETYSTDLGTGGCVTFNVPNRSVDEFDYYSVVRTTEPEIRGVTLGAAPPSKRPPRRDAMLARLILAIRHSREQDEEAELAVRLLQSLSSVPDEVSWLIETQLRDDPRMERLAAFSEAVAGALAAEASSTAGTPAGRAALDAANPVDWDSTPTFYEAATIAHGHLLHFKQVWYADGYSLGDLLYSLPLAPGQKRMIAVLDWERQDGAAREEGTFFSEGLQASLSRDRDLSEVVSGALTENVRGGSSSETAGVGVGTGAAGNGSYQSFNFGALVGVSGGYGSSNATAWQNSAKTVGTQSMQRLRDTTLQSASAVRGLRSTVVHSASQGESVRASTEVVANHNRCHAMTVQYFEVLRHLRVELELADVQECLFVPLPMTPFDAPKALRWREPLSSYLRDRRLAGAFEALSRVETAWADVDAPAARYGDELVTSITGEMDLTMLVPMPPIPEVPAPTPGQVALDAVTSVGEALNPTKGFLGGLLAVATGGLSLLAGGAVNAAAQGASATAEALARTPTAEAKYAKFHREVMPGIAAGFVDQLQLWMVNGTSQVRIQEADFTLVSDYRAGEPMLVSVRAPMSVGVARSSITRMEVRSANGLPTGCRAILNRAVMRYRTSTFEHVLVDDQRLNDDIDLPRITLSWTGTGVTITMLRDGVGATMFTPIDTWEQRSPRKEDQRLAAELLRHLNDNLEHYHHAVWWRMDPNRRYMLLDGYTAPNSNGRSVASVTENRLIGIVGNSLVLPVARGVHLDPRFAPTKRDAALDLRKHYAPTTPIAPSRISLPTRGVFAEAVLGSCNSCEQIDETRMWRWEDHPMDDLPVINPLSTDSRRAEPLTIAPSTFPTSLVSIQTAADAPDPAGVSVVTDLLGKASPFADITGLAATQSASLAAYTKALDTAQAFGKEASTLAQQAAMTKGIDKSMDAINKAESSGGITADEAQSLRVSALRKLVGGEDGLTGEKVKERLGIVDEAAKSGSIGQQDATELNKKTLDRYVRIDDPGKPEEDAAAKKISELEGVDKVKVGQTEVTSKAKKRQVAVTLSANYEDDSPFFGQFDLGFQNDVTGQFFTAAFETSGDPVRQVVNGMPAGAYTVYGRIARTRRPAPVASGPVTIVGTGGPFTLTVPLEYDTTTGAQFQPTGRFTLAAGVRSIALAAVPTTRAKTVKTSISLSTGLTTEAEVQAELSTKVAAGVILSGEVEGKAGMSLKASGSVSAGQSTEFEVTYRVITGIAVKPLA